MSLIFTDSFAHVSTAADVEKKWDVCGDTPTWVEGRWGPNSYAKHVGSTNHGVGRYVPSRTEYTTGFALNVQGYVNTSSRWSFCEGHGSGSGGTYHVWFQGDGLGHLQATRNGTVLGTTTWQYELSRWYYIEQKVRIDDTNGGVWLRVDEQDVLRLGAFAETPTTLDTRNGGVGEINYITLMLGPGATGQSVYITDVYFLDANGGAPTNDFLGDVRVEPLWPVGPGNKSQWSPSSGVNYSTVDERIPSTTDYNSTSTVNNIDTFELGNITAGTGTVYGVGTYLYARKTEAGGRSIAPVWRLGGTDFVGENKPLSAGWDYEESFYDVNPDTGNPWTIGEIDGAEFGYKLTL